MITHRTMQSVGIAILMTRRLICTTIRMERAVVRYAQSAIRRLKESDSGLRRSTTKLGRLNKKIKLTWNKAAV